MNEKTILFLMLAALPGCPNDGDDANDTGNATNDVETSEGSDSSSGDVEPLAIAGTYDDEFGGHHEITDTTWVYDTGEFGVITTNLMQHDNEAGWVAGEDAENAGTFVRFDWTYDADDVLWYCNSVFDATSLQAAIDAPLANGTNPAMGGCGGFAWTMLTPA